MVEKFTQAQTRTVVYKKTLLLKKTRDGSLFPIFYTSCVIQCGGQTETDGVEPGLVLVFHFSPIHLFSHMNKVVVREHFTGPASIRSKKINISLQACLCGLHLLMRSYIIKRDFGQA